MKSSRPFVVAANWKMNKGPREAVEFLRAFVPQIETENLATPDHQIVIFIPAIDLWVSEQALRGTGIGWGAQNVHFEEQGAFTGENSPVVVKELGATHALVGHSERRALFNETDLETGKKVKALQKLGLTPMLCVGESLTEREADRTDEVIVRQLRAGLAGANLDQSFAIAYEPVWAIGTGKVATPEQANQAHGVLRRSLVEIGGSALADRVSILYGGSVKPENAAQLAAQSEVDGFLIGGASLEVGSFMTLCRFGQNSK